MALGLANVFDADMDTLLNDTSIDQFVDTDTNSRLRDIKDNTGSSMVSLVRHTLVDGRIGKDINVVTDLDRHQVLRKVRESMLTERLGKHSARTRSLSE